MPNPVYAIATMDTKEAELAFVASQLAGAGVHVLTIDVGTGGPPSVPVNIRREQVAECHPAGAKAVLGLTDRGRGRSHEHRLENVPPTPNRRPAASVVLLDWGELAEPRVITPSMRALPIGLPKVMVSTVAGGNVSAYVGSSDLIMFPSIVDVAGLNSVSRRILSNAAHALAGMVTAKQSQSRRTALPSA